MASAWTINHWPRIGCHVFLSHVAEDRERLVLPVYEALRERQIIPWIDRHDYPLGRRPIETLREEILRCRHVVYFLTPAMLRQGRGWPVMEPTLASLAQEQILWQGAELQHIELPLLFVKANHPVLSRSVWQPLVNKAIQFAVTRAKGESRFDWATRMIARFVDQEAKWAEDIRRRLRHDSAARQNFSESRNLLRRIRGVDPIVIRGLD